MREPIRPAQSAAKRNNVTRAMRHAALQMMADGGLGWHEAVVLIRQLYTGGV
jgi:hypothetical protein